MRRRAARPLHLRPGSVWIVLAALALGVGARVSDVVAPKWVGNVVAVWFLAGFVAGLTTGSRRRGAARGVLALVVATVSYYALRVAVDALTLEQLVPIPVGWLAVGIVSGAVSGWAGALARSQPALWGVPAGAFLGEAAAVVVLRQRIGQASVEIACAAVCVWLGRSAWPRALLAAASTMPYVAGFAVLYRYALWS